LLDPPRSGAERETIENLIKLKPSKIVYVSCNPATLARDLLALTNGNYEIENIRAFDFFPQTHHVETIVHLVLKTP
jgi:23S rRNA (uracil1939-C5)-methyltransferase